MTPRTYRVLAVALPPVMCAGLLLVHPTDAPTAANAAFWTGLHIGLLWLFPSLALGAASLLEGSGGPFATLARLALWLYVVLYVGAEAVQGIGTGVLAASGHEEAAVVLLTSATPELAARVGAVAWLIALWAIGIAVQEQGRPVKFAGMLVVSALPLTLSHAPPFGLVAMGLYATAAGGLVIHGR